jgi:hypothetical protein
MKIRSILTGGAIAGSLIVASPALAVSPPGGLGATTTDNGTTWVFTWTAPGDADATVHYIGGPVTPADPTPTADVTSGSPMTVPADATAFEVAAVDGSGTSGYTPITLDRVPPSISYAFGGTPTAGWYSALTITPTCSEPLTPAAACSPTTWSADGVIPPADTTITDAAGNTATATRPGFSFDGTLPAETDPSGQPAGQLLNPGPNALVASEPAFSWTKGYDALSGVDHYDLQYKKATDDEWTTIATVADHNDVGDYTARRDPDLAGPMPAMTALDWRVRVVDTAGNVYKTPSRRFKIDPTVPPAPAITGGPAAPTQQSSPTFTWTGTQDLYSWDLTAAGNDNPVRQGSGSARSVTINALPDGTYTFRVRQITGSQQAGADATRTFVIDTVAPNPPLITLRPSAPSVVAPTFAWQGEPGAYSRWTLMSSTGQVLQGPVDTPVTKVTLPTLADGTYTFQVQQIDAAGNVSAPTVEPFTVLAPLVPLSPNAALLSILPKQNATRLLPRAGKTLPTRRPVLQWHRGPRATKLYNLQIFRVTKGKGKRPPKVRKVLSAFPKGLQLRAPAKTMLPSTCYVWRVWPYTGRVFTPKPVGVSNFCIANSKTLKKAAARAAARKKAARRKAALLRARTARH